MRSESPCWRSARDIFEKYLSPSTFSDITFLSFPQCLCHQPVRGSSFKPSFVRTCFFSDARMGAVSLDERHRARIERMMMEEEEAKELEVEVTNIHHFFTLFAQAPFLTIAGKW